MSWKKLLKGKPSYPPKRPGFDFYRKEREEDRRELEKFLQLANDSTSDLQESLKQIRMKLDIIKETDNEEGARIDLELAKELATISIKLREFNEELLPRGFDSERQEELPQGKFPHM
jgi:hypothetical protein